MMSSVSLLNGKKVRPAVVRPRCRDGSCEGAYFLHATISSHGFNNDSPGFGSTLRLIGRRSNIFLQPKSSLAFPTV